MRITQEFVIDIGKPERGQVFYRDSELRGFAVRVTSGAASYVVECRVNGKLQRTTLGRLTQLTAEEAREKAQAVLSGMTSRRVHASYRVPTLQEVAADYLSKKRLRANTVVIFPSLCGQ